MAHRRLDLPLTRRRWLLRSAGANFAAVVVPAVVGIVAIPTAVRSLGVEGYGILSLAMVALTDVSLFDFGLSRAATRRPAALAMSASLVPVLLASLVRGLLEATRCFDLIKIVRIPSTTLILAVPALPSVTHADPVGVGFAAFLSQSVSGAAYTVLG